MTTQLKPVNPTLPGRGHTTITVYGKYNNLLSVPNQTAHNIGSLSITRKRVRVLNIQCRMPESPVKVRFCLALDYDLNVYDTRTGILLFNMDEFATAPMLRKVRDYKHTINMVQTVMALYVLHYNDKLHDPVTYTVLDRYLRGYRTANNLSVNTSSEVWQVRVVADFDGDVGQAHTADDNCGTQVIEHLKEHEKIDAWWSLYKYDGDGLPQWMGDAQQLEALRLMWVSHTMTDPDVIKDVVNQDIEVPAQIVRPE